MDSSSSQGRFRRLTEPPSDPYALLELALEWDDLGDVEAQLAAAVRLFVITRDPLDWIPDRGSEWSTANADGDTLELPVYVALAALEGELDDDERLEARFAGIAARVLETAVGSRGVVLAGAYPSLAIRGDTPRLLGGEGDASAVVLPRVGDLGSAGWEPLGLGAIQDLVQDAFGPVDFDRSRVRLDPVAQVRPDCPACAGASFGFPAELDQGALTMCRPHRDTALELAERRIEQAKSSNRPGWRALGKASARTSGQPEPRGNPLPPRRGGSPGRNDPCPCGSGRKYKRCCGAV